MVLTSLLTIKKTAAAVHHQDNLEFLEDTIPKAVPYKEVKQKAAETRAKLTGANPASAPPPAEDDAAAAAAVAATTTNGNSSGSKKQKTLSNGVNGLGLADVVKEPSSHGEKPAAAAAEAPAATGDDDDDVQMTG